MRLIFLLLLITIPMTVLSNHKTSESESELFVVLTSADEETQMMAMVLATQSANQDVQVRVLLCSDAGYLAVEGEESRTFEPAGRSPKDLLNGLIQNGVTVEVCGIFLPNRDLTEEHLIDGITAASPPEVAAYMKKPGLKLFTF